MLPTGGPWELELPLPVEFETRQDVGLESAAEGGGTEVTEGQAADWETSREEGALGLCANGQRRHYDDDDSDSAFDDFGDGTGEHEDSDDDFDDDGDSDDGFGEDDDFDAD